MWDVEREIVDSSGRPLLLFNTGLSPFSNFYNAPFKVHEEEYRTSEQYYQYWKAAYFGDLRRALAIRNEPRPGKCKHLAKNIQNFDPNVWRQVAPLIMQQALLAKFRQHDAIRKKLVGTGDVILVEASPFSTYWGSGLDIFDDNHKELWKWRGANMLGTILTQVRDILRDEK